MRTRFFGWHTIFHDDRPDDPYMTRIWFGRLRLHIFYRGDADPDPHDHPWDFWTFPLVSYVEEVTVPALLAPGTFTRRRQLVRAFRWHRRPAEHLHRVIGAFDGWWVDPDIGFLYPGSQPLGDHDEPQTDGARIVTLVWRGQDERRWGFLKHRDGQWCWIHWKEYALRGGKHAPCEPEAFPAEVQSGSASGQRVLKTSPAEAVSASPAVQRPDPRAGFAALRQAFETEAQR